MLDCEIDEQVSRIDNPDRIERMKGSDPEGYRRHRQIVELFEPPADEVIRLDTTAVSPETNAEKIYRHLLAQGLRRSP